MGLSYLPQEASIFRRLSVADNIRAVLELKSYTADEMQQRLDDLLHDLHIGHIRTSQGISLSGGERQHWVFVTAPTLSATVQYWLAVSLTKSFIMKM